MLPRRQPRPLDEGPLLRRLHRQPRTAHPAAQRRAGVGCEIHAQAPTVRDGAVGARVPVEGPGAAVRVGVAEARAEPRGTGRRPSAQGERQILVAREQNTAGHGHAARLAVEEPAAEGPFPQPDVRETRERQVRRTAGARGDIHGRHGRTQTRRRGILQRRQRSRRRRRRRLPRRRRTRRRQLCHNPDRDRRERKRGTLRLSRHGRVRRGKPCDSPPEVRGVR